MAKYVTLFPVYKRMEKRFTRQQIETAARVCFYQHPPEDHIVDPDQELDLMWASDMVRGGKLIRVVGDVQEPKKRGSKNAQAEGH